MTTTPNLDAVKSTLLELQNSTCEAFLAFESNKTFHTDEWQRELGGGGITRVIEGGETFDKGGVNFSHVFGGQLPPAATKARPELAGATFEAMGVSIVMHPVNPFVPTSHANVRLFTAKTKTGETIWWFGGGFDLTPYFPFEEDCALWHHAAKDAVEPFAAGSYQRFKNWCDKYFYLPHRDETRGVGGLFFDDINERDFSDCLNLIKRVGESYRDTYAELVQKRHQTAYTENDVAFQQYRRGRYVEFNLLYDRGTLFGLQSGGRTESILMSLPRTANWQYQNTQFVEQEDTLKRFLKPRDWV